jgi:hypothetical protein
MVLETALALVLLLTGAVVLLAQEPIPQIWVPLDRYDIYGHNWPDGTTVTLTIDDPDTPTSPDYTDQQAGDGNQINFPLQGWMPEPGQIVTMSDGTITKTHIVAEVAITGIDAETNLVSGIAPPGAEISVWVKDRPDCGTQEADEGPAGNWTADFSCDLVKGDTAEAAWFDSDGDHTTYPYTIPDPSVQVANVDDPVIADMWPADSIECGGWPKHVTVTLEIDDPATPQQPDLVDSLVMPPAPWSPGIGHLTVQLDGVYDIKAGQVVTVTGGGYARMHVVTALKLTGVNLDLYTVSGTAAPGSEVTVAIYRRGQPSSPVTVIAGEEGDWTAPFAGVDDFALPFTVDAGQTDGGGDRTVVRIRVDADGDEDGIPDGIDNAPDVFNPDQLDSDTDGLADVIDPCPNDASDECDPAGSASGSFGPEGGNLVTPDGTVDMQIPSGALAEHTSLSITEGGENIELTTDLGTGLAVFGVHIGPEETTFAVPVNITLRWDDADDDGVVDGTDQQEADLVISKDGVVVSDRCADDPDCDSSANTFALQVSSLSFFALLGPLDTDGDGVPDDFRGIVDACPTTPGNANRQGCPVGIAVSARLVIRDPYQHGACPDGGRVCMSPLAGAEVRVFDPQDPDFQAAYGSTTSLAPEYETVFETGIGQAGTCTTCETGRCTAGLEAVGRYLILLKYRDVDTDTILYRGRQVFPFSFLDTDRDGVRDLAIRRFRIIQVFSEDGSSTFLGP